MNRACKAASFNIVGIELQTQAKKKKEPLRVVQKEASRVGVRDSVVWCLFGMYEALHLILGTTKITKKNLLVEERAVVQGLRKTKEMAGY